MKSKVFVSVVILVCVTFFAASCTTDPYTGNRKVSNTAKGAGIGAAGGAAAGLAVGLLTGKTKSKQLRKRALVGAGIGALAGGSVGAYMDYQEAKLRQRLRKTGVSITREGDRIILNMPGNITFATGSADIKSNFYEILNSVDEHPQGLGNIDENLPARAAHIMWLSVRIPASNPNSCMKGRILIIIATSSKNSTGLK